MTRWLFILLAVVAGWFSPANAHALTRAGQAGYDAGAALEKVVFVVGITMDTDEGDREDPLSLHKYIYCEGNPVNNVDPTGHDIEGLVDLSGAIGDIGAQIGTYKTPSDYVYYGALTPAEQAQVNQAIAEARKYADDAWNYMRTTTYDHATARYTTWFGASTQRRFGKVKDAWASMDTAIWNTLTIKKTTGAYYGLTYPLFTDTIRLGNDFWTAPLVGEDSQAGTLLHELSHTKAGTGDKAYGADDCRALAISSPNKAVKNADSYEYFCELK